MTTIATLESAPANQAESMPVEPPKHAQSWASRILVVDDNPAIHEDFRKILCPGRSQAQAAVDQFAAEFFDDLFQEQPIAEFQVDSAFQGQEALGMVQAAEGAGSPYSLAFMDVRMPPGWDGIETISQIWKLYPHIQIVICTAYSDYSWGQILGQLGETDNLVVLKKPFDNIEVLQLAHTLTKKWILTRQAAARVADLDEVVRLRTRDLSQANERLQEEIQQRSSMEAALRESEERFHKAFETVPVACLIRPLDTGRYLDVNERFAQLCGYPKEEILGKTPQELGIVVDPGRLAQLIQAARDGEQVHEAEIEIRHKNGKVRQALESIELLKLGERTCLLAVLQDVTERKLLEGQLRQAQKMEAIGQLATGVAHDFNNLLTVIQGYASLQLAKSALDTEIAKAFTQVNLAAQRASSLTRQLLAFSRKEMVRHKSFELGATVLKLKSMLSRILGETIRLECEIDPGPSWVCGDETSLEQVIMNLSVNARDAMPQGGRLRIDVGRKTFSAAQAVAGGQKREGQFVVLLVTDTGYGMDPATLSRIFEPFFTTKPIGRGTGLGLSTVYGIIKHHNGWIEVESQPGKGSIFRVFLAGVSAPIATETSEAAIVRDPLPTLPPDEAILIVEDESAVRDYIASALVQQGYRVVQANSGAEALLNWKKLDCRVRLVITDLVMPGGISGSLLAQRLIHRQPGLKVIYMSGYSPELLTQSDRFTEGLNFLPKPFTQDRLIQTVRNALSADSSGL